MNRVDDLMTKNSVSLSPHMQVKDAVRLLTQHSLDGAPVIDSDGRVVGILTEYDLSLKGTGIHLPTLAKLFEEFDFYKIDKSAGGIAALLSMRVEEVMNTEPILLRPYASLNEAARIFAKHHHLNPIPIISEQDGKLLGVIDRFNLLKYFAGEGEVLVDPKQIDRRVDKDVNRFLNTLERRVLFVSKSRTRFWLIFSLLFIIIGFFVATVAIINVSF